MNLDNLLPNSAKEDVEEIIDCNNLDKLVKGIVLNVGENLVDLKEKEFFVPRFFFAVQIEEKVVMGNRKTEVKKSENNIDLEGLISKMNSFKNIVICDAAGTGKSVILQKIGLRIKQKFPNRWVIFVNLKNYVHVFKQHLDFQFDHAFKAVDYFVDEIYTTKRQDNGFGRRVLKLKLEKSGGVVLLFDGFDEISPKYGKVVYRLLLGLNKSSVENMVVTTRPYAAKELSKHFEATFFRLRPFSKDDQSSFLVKYWLGNSNFKDELKLKCKATRLIDTFCSSIKDAKFQFMGVPLQCRLLADVYKNNLSDKPKNMSVYELYEKFVEIKFEEEHNRYQSANSTSGQENCAIAKEFVTEYHWESSFRMFEEIDGHKLKLHRFQKDGKEALLEKVKRIGIVTRTGDSPKFIHHTFAEFFIGNFFINRINHLDGDDFLKVFQILLENILGAADSSLNVRNFFESGLKNLTIAKEKFLLIQRSLLKDWPLNSRSIYENFFNTFKITSENNVNTYSFLLNCLIIDGKVPNEFFPLLVAAAPDLADIPYNVSPSTDIFFQLLSACFQNVQDVIMTQVMFRNNWNEQNSSTFTPKLPRLSVTFETLLEKKRLFDDFLKAAAAGDVERLTELLRKAGNRETRFLLLNPCSHNRACGSALISAIKNNCGEAVEFLINRGAPVNQPDFDLYQPALFTAIKLGNLKCVEILLKSGADLTQKYEGMEPLEAACYYGKSELIRCLLNFDFDKTNSLALHFAILRNNIGMFDRGLNVHQEDEERQSPVPYSARKMYKSSQDRSSEDTVIKLLVNNGLDTENRNSNGTTALHIATMGGTTETVETLLGLGANIEAKGKEGRTALHIAAKRNEYRDNLIEILIKHGADIHVRDNYGKTAFNLIPEGISRRGIFNLLDGHWVANVHAVRNDGLTQMHIEAKCGHVEIVSTLLKLGANIAAMDNKGRTPLHEAVTGEHCRKGLIRLLLKNGADPNAKDSKGKTPLDLAIDKWDRMIRKLANKGALERPTGSYLKDSTKEDILARVSEGLNKFKKKTGQINRRALAGIIKFLIKWEN